MLALKPRTADDAPILDARSTTCIKGVLCFYVMFHNLGLDLIDNSPFKENICERSGGVGVGLFFFLSAFGIIRAYQAKGNGSLKKLLLVNVPRLYIISVIINLITYLAFFKDFLEPTDAFLRLFNLDVFNDFNRMNRHGWYITTIIGLYIIFAAVFFIASKFKTEKKFIVAAIVLAAIAVGFRLGAQIADEGGMYTREMPAFAIGALYATFYDKVNAFVSKYFKLTLSVSVALFCLGFFLIWEPLATYCACVIIIAVSQRFTYYNNITHFFGKICIGVYLFLHLSSMVLQSFIYNEYLWVLLNGAFIIELSVLLYALEYALKYVFKKCRLLVKTKRGEF